MAKNEVSVIIRAKDLASKAFKSVERAWRATVRVLRVGATAIAAVGTAAAGAVVAVGKLAQRGGEVLGVQRAFERTFGNGARAINTLRDATRNLIPDMELMRNANQAVALGAADSVEEFGEMARLAQDLDRALGLGGEGLEKLTVALARQSKLRLDDLGITIDVTEANERYAAQVGKSADALTDSEKKIAFRNEALRRGRELVEQMGASELEAADQVNRAATAFQNFRDRLAVMTAESEAVNDFFEAIANLGTDIVDALNGDADLVAETAKAVGGLAGNAFSVAFLEAAGRGLEALDRIVLPKSLEKDFVTPFGAVGGGLRAFADDAREAAAAWRETLASLGRQGRSRSEARGLGRTGTLGSGGTTGGAGGAGGSGTGTGTAGSAVRIPGVPQTIEELRSLVARLDETKQALAQARLEETFATTGEEAKKAADKVRELETRLAALRAPASAFGGEGLLRVQSELAGIRGLPIPGAGTFGLQAIRPSAPGVSANAPGDGVVEEAGKFDEAAQVAVASFGAMAEAAVRGGDLTADSVIGMMTRIVQNIPGVSGFAGSIIGAVGGIVGGLFSGSRDKPRVVVDDLSDRAARKMAEAAEERPIRISNQFITPEGKTIEEIEYELNRRQRRDAVPRYTGRR